MTITQVKENLIGMGHSGTLNKVRNFEAAMERAANNLLLMCDPIETERIVPLSQVVHDDLNNYALAADFKSLIDLYPQAGRTNLDSAQRTLAERFSLQVALANKIVSIESSEGSEFIRINWKSRQAKLLHNMNSVTANGTWSAVGSATSVTADTIYKISGSASIRFNIVASGDGIQNSTMTKVDFTTENGIAEVIVPVYLPIITALTSITPIWGSDLTTNYWTGVAQTAQADGTAFRIGWNYIKVPWSSATASGTSVNAQTDSFKLTFQTTGAISNVRVDNILFSIGRPFDMKYYSNYLFRSTAGVFMARTASDDDVVVLVNPNINLFLYEGLIACSQQVEGEDSAADIQFANRMLHGDPTALDEVGRMGLYAKYRSEHPSQRKKAVTSWSSGPRFRK
jgi:hypothetical protein